MFADHTEMSFRALTTLLWDNGGQTAIEDLLFGPIAGQRNPHQCNVAWSSLDDLETRDTVFSRISCGQRLGRVLGEECCVWDIWGGFAERRMKRNEGIFLNLWSGLFDHLIGESTLAQITKCISLINARLVAVNFQFYKGNELIARIKLRSKATSYIYDAFLAYQRQ